MIRRALDWLANAKSVNDEVNADALRIADLEQTLASVRGDLARAIQGNAAWAAKFAEITAEMQRAAPLVAYALRQKANRARYDAKRRGK
jgi:N-acetylglutamate synthase/N-acetylornithine aminotransferase